MEKIINRAIDRVNEKYYLLPGKWTQKGQREILFQFCLDNSVVPSLVDNVNCLCPVIKGGSHRWRDDCENDPESLVGFDVLDHIVFFRDINPPKKIILAVGQPYFQTLDESDDWRKTLTQWGYKKGLRVILNNGPGASWWNPGEGKTPHLGHCITIEFWNDSKASARN